MNHERPFRAPFIDGWEAFTFNYGNSNIHFLRKNWALHKKNRNTKKGNLIRSNSTNVFVGPSPLWACDLARTNKQTNDQSLSFLSSSTLLFNHLNSEDKKNLFFVFFYVKKVFYFLVFLVLSFFKLQINHFPPV